MTEYQTTIQKPGAIRFGSAKIEIENDDNEWIDLGALKSVSSKVNVSEGTSYEPDNAPKQEMDATVESWDWTATVEEIWDIENWKLLRGDADTYTSGTGGTTIGIEAGSGTRPERRIRITNTTPGEAPVEIILAKAKCTSQLDFTFGTDADRTTAIGLPVTWRALPDIAGFGTLFIPNTGTTVTIEPAAVTIDVAATQQLNVTGATEVTYGTLNTAVATVTASGLITGLSAGMTTVIVTADGLVKRIPVTVMEEEEP